MAVNRVAFLLPVRQFAVSARAQKLVQPPIQVFGVDGRYASAAYSAAAKEKKLEVVEKDLKQLKEVLSKNASVRETLANPIIPAKSKIPALQKTLAELNCSNLTVNLITAIAENGRLKRLDNIISNYVKLMSAHRGEVTCSVTTARTLDDTQLREVRTILQSFVSGTQSIHLETKTDPAIVGGMIVTIGDKYVDMSIASKIRKYTEMIKQAA